MKKINHYGYYVFLGLGDFAQLERLSPQQETLAAPSPFTSEWTSTWDLFVWREKIEHWLRLGTNTLFVYLMGHRLPYRSEKFRDCVEAEHPYVRNDFFQDVVDSALEKNIQLVAVFSTTGHAKCFTALHPHLAIHDRNGIPQPDTGILCHHKEEGRDYPLQVIRECLTRYHGFTGVILHPPEFHYPCFCEDCQEECRQVYGKELLSASNEEAQRFFMESNLHFQRTVLEAEIRLRLPDAELLTFTIPWVFEPHFERIAKQLDPNTIIVDWDYDLSEERAKMLQARLNRYKQFGNKVWFMPTSGYAFSRDGSREQQEQAVLRQIQLVLDAGVTDIIYFTGPAWWQTVEGTSWYLRTRLPSQDSLSLPERT